MDKERLEYLLNQTYYHYLDQEEAKELIDYVTNLEKRNAELQQRIEKAIEYINENWGHWCSNHFVYATEVIKILKGDK